MAYKFDRKKWLQDPKVRKRINAYKKEWARKDRLKKRKPRVFKDEDKCACCGILLTSKYGGQGDGKTCSECLKIPVI